MTSENDIGKKPTINMRNGINRSAISGVPKRLTKFCATPAVHVIKTGKNSVNNTIGVIMRQSRNVSRSSRRTIIHMPLNQLTLCSTRCNGCHIR